MDYPENIEEIKKFAEDIGIDVEYLLGEKWEVNLVLPNSVKSLPANIEFNVGGWLWIPSAESLSANIKFNVGGYLSLSSVKSLQDNTVFNVGGWLDLISVQSLPANTKFNVDGNIYLPMKHKVKVIW